MNVAKNSITDVADVGRILNTEAAVRRCSSKFRYIHKKTPVLESLLIKQKSEFTGIELNA